jgi:CrcB protein
MGLMARFRLLMAVALGGSAGALSRWGVLSAVPSDAVEWATWAINVVGSVGLGALLGRRELLSAQLLAGLGTGFAGGFTTFSAYAVSVATAVDGGRLDDALVIGLATPLVALVGAGIGYRISRRSLVKARKAAARRAAETERP